MKLKIIIYLLFLILSFISGFLLNGISLTGRAVQENNESYKWTKAVCNEKNECIDILIECKNNKIISVSPASNLVKHESNWTDPRENKEIFCE